MWHSQHILQSTCKIFSLKAHVAGALAFDELSLGSKARSRAITYCPNKPDKFGVRLYGLSSASPFCPPYLFSYAFNGAGDKTKKPLVEKYVDLHRELRTPYYKHVKNSKIIDGDSSAALWSMQIYHATMKDPQKRRVVFIDSFYTRHQLGEVVKKLTDNKTKIYGTQKFNLIDATNRTYVKKAMSMVEKLERGSWALVRAYDKVDDLDKLRREHNKLQKNLPSNERKPFTPPTSQVADKAGYIIFKDKKIVIFYTNDLACTPSKPILLGKSEEAIKAVNGLGKLYRWTGNENMCRIEFLVPIMVVAYNKFMSGIDRIDQLIATYSYIGREIRLNYKILLYVIDLCIYNAFSLQKQLENSDKINVREFKRRVLVSMLESNEKSEEQCEKREENLGKHILLNFDNEQSDQVKKASKPNQKLCFLCPKLHNKRKFVCTGCFYCKVPFCLPCYSKYHNPELLSCSNTKAKILNIQKSEAIQKCKAKGLKFDTSDFNI